MSHLKASSATARQKVNIIISNREKVSNRAMCKLLGVPRSLVYYHLNKDQEEVNEKLAKEELTIEIREIFRKSKNNYGSRKIKVELKKKGFIVSRRKISRIMNENGLVSNYTVKQFRPEKSLCNEKKIENLIKEKN